MVDFNGGGGLVGLDPNGWMGNYNGFTGMTAPQINQSMGMGYGGAGDQNQALLNNIFGNFGQQTAHYSGLGAAYGRQTGGFGGLGAPNADPFTPVGGGGPWSRAGANPFAGRGAAAPSNIFSRGPANPSGAVERGPDLAPPSGIDASFNQGGGGSPWENYGGGGGYNPFSPQTYAPSAQSNLGARSNPFGGGGFSRGMSAFQPTPQPPAGGGGSGMLGDIGMGGESGSPGANPFAGGGGGYNPFSPQSFAPSSNFGGMRGGGSPFGGGGRNSLAQLLSQANSPPQQPPPDQRLWSGNFFGAQPPPNTVGNSVGMAPGFGGFNNPPNQAQDNWSQAFRHMNSNFAPGG